LNGNVVVDEQRRLKPGDVVKVFDDPRAAPATEQDVRIRYIDEHLVIVEKPAGVTTLRQSDEGGRHNRRLDRMATLEEMLQRVVAKRTLTSKTGTTARAETSKGRKHPLARGGRAPFKRPDNLPPVHRRPPQVRPVHRLDRDTSGLMVFALSPEAEQSLTQLFRQHEVDRKYLAVVHGHPAEQTIESYFVRDRGDGLRGSTPRGMDDPSAQRAVTHLRPMERVGDYSVVECRLETGRTHQIRIHLAERGHMLCGEKTYTRPTPGSAPLPERSAAPRQALHSASLAFTHPITGKELNFRSPLPPDLAQWLERLRRASGY
jgi:23S rRNA pseudouridine1911/1915/1917 synthase